MRCVCAYRESWTSGFSDRSRCMADGTDVTPISPNQRTVLALLAAHPDRHVRADTATDLDTEHSGTDANERDEVRQVGTAERR